MAPIRMISHYGRIQNYSPDHQARIIRGCEHIMGDVSHQELIVQQHGSEFLKWNYKEEEDGVTSGDAPTEGWGRRRYF